jgi:trigger factor
MNVSVVDISENQKKLQVEIPASRVQEELEGRYRELAKQVKIKGFRPGKIPKSILKSYYGKALEGEVSSQLIQESFPEALREADLKPLVEADVNETNFDDNGAFTYTAIIDVCPPLEIDGYKGLQLQRQPVQVAEEQEQAELDRILDQHSQLRTIEEERPVKEGDVAVIDFTPSVDGEIFDRGKAQDYMLEIGKQTIHPEFDNHVVGQEVGKPFSFELDYPEDAPTPEIQGKRVRFEVEVKEIKEKVRPELDDEFAKEAGKFESLDELKQSIRERLTKREEDRISTEVRQQIVDQLLTMTTFELSSKVIDREVDRMVGMLQHQFESQGLKIDTSRLNTAEIRAEYRPQAEKNLRRRLILEQIAKQENIELTEEDKEQIYAEVARFARMDIEKVKREYADSSIIEQSSESKIQDKVLKLLEDSAVYTEASQEEKSPEQE